MDNRHQNKLGTFFRAILYLNYNLTPLAAIVNILNSLAAKLNDNVDLLNTYAIGSDQNNLGSAVQKEISFMRLGEAVVSTASSFVGYYKSIDNHAMAGQGEITKSEFDAFTDTEAFVHTGGFLKILSPYVPALGEDWNVTPERIAGLAAKLEVFKNYMEEPRFQQQMKAKFRTLMLTQFDVVDAILELIDLAIESIKQSNPELYIGWRNIRTTYDDAATHSNPNMTLTILPNSFLVAGNYPFLAIRAFKLINRGPNEVGFGLTDNAAGYSNYERIVQAGHTSQVQSSTLGSSGNILLLHNNTNEPITVDIWVYE